MRSKTARTVAYSFIVIAVLAVGALVYRSIQKRNEPIVFSEKSMLETIWQRYKTAYFEQGTSRTIDPSRGNITTSEGEGYSMLRAVWLDDHPAFDASWNWTKANLQFSNGYLFSWLYGKKSDGTYGILTDQNGQNSASDADTDIAVALLFAFARWRDPAYLASARDIIDAIWQNEVVIIQGKPYLAADDVERKYTSNVVVNPSYLAPYAYRMFATIDPGHDWNGLVDTSYQLLDQSMVSPLNTRTGKSASLPPDWITIDRNTGTVQAGARNGPQGALDTDFSYDALRIPWRIALDWYWYQDPRANNILHRFGFLDTQWKQNHLLFTDYGHEGSVIQPASESAAMYGGSIGAFMAMAPDDAKDMYEKKLVNLYNPDSDSWKQPLGYYDDNWAWFGLALYDNELPNLWASVIKQPRQTVTN